MFEKIKTIQSLIGTTVDGSIGPKTLQAICTKLNIKYIADEYSCVKNIQNHVGSTADGIIGPKTLESIIAFISKPTIISTIKNIWNKITGKETTSTVDVKDFKPTEIKYKAKLVKQSTIRRGSSSFGPAGCEDRLVSVKVPAGYPLKYDGTPVKAIRVHELVADRLEAALNDIVAYYGPDIEKIAPGVCIYDGSYNFRKTRNSSSQSIHSWGLAIDFDAAHNGLKTPWAQARFSQEVYKPFIDIMEYHGWKSLGRHSGKDSMHFQCTEWG